MYSYVCPKNSMYTTYTYNVANNLSSDYKFDQQEHEECNLVISSLSEEKNT